MITIVDYGMGNLASIANMLKRVGAPSRITSRPEEVASADRLILPGVGAFDTGIRNLRASGLIEVLDQQVRARRVPVLGICLGMQLLAKSSEEGTQEGLGWLDATCVRFQASQPGSSLKVPHMGWNAIEAVRPTPLLDGLETGRFYFVHSFYLRVANTDQVVAQTRYGRLFPSVVQAENVLGVQFHPEKSHKYGMRLLRNFSERYPR